MNISVYQFLRNKFNNIKQKLPANRLRKQGYNPWGLPEPLDACWSLDFVGPLSPHLQVEDEMTPELIFPEPMRFLLRGCETVSLSGFKPAWPGFTFWLLPNIFVSLGKLLGLRIYVFPYVNGNNCSVDVMDRVD
jgi:hypothetical protein